MIWILMFGELEGNSLISEQSCQLKILDDKKNEWPRVIR